MGWAIRIGTFFFLVAQLLGGVMLARGFDVLRHRGDVAAASMAAGSLVLVHALCIHSIQVLPLAAWLAGKLRSRSPSQ